MRGMERLKSQMIEAVHGGPQAVPEAGAVLWQAFVALSRTRTIGGLGPNPIGYAEIEAWCRLFRMPLKPHHVEIVVAMDQVWLKGSPQKRSPITPAAFDAVFG